MTILEDENIILNDDLLVIIMEIKKWFARNVYDIIKYKHNSSLKIKSSLVDKLFDDFKEIYKGISFVNDEEYYRYRFEYLINIDHKISNYIQIDLNTQPINITIDGNLVMMKDCESIPTNLFQISKINGDLDVAFCKLESTDGFPDRENIQGNIYWTTNYININKYDNQSEKL